MAHVDQENLLKEKRSHLLRVSKQRWLLRLSEREKFWSNCCGQRIKQWKNS